MWLLSPSGV
jgi:hypothetical protein